MHASSKRMRALEIALEQKRPPPLMKPAIRAVRDSRRSARGPIVHSDRHRYCADVRCRECAIAIDCSDTAWVAATEDEAARVMMDVGTAVIQQARSR